MMKTKEYYINNLNVLYEDNHLIVIEKPINVLSQKDNTNDFDINEIVKEYLKNKYNKPGNVYLGLVHRLDRRVGGVLLLTKTSKAASRLSEDIRNQKLEKYYIVKTKGIIENNGSINVKIKKDEKTRKAIICNDGKLSLLDYEVINYDQDNTFAIVNLHTGRYNQIRASFNYIKHPVFNDYKYTNEKKNDNQLGLWCYKICINHPITKEKMIFECYPKGNIWEKLSIEKIKKLEN